MKIIKFISGILLSFSLIACSNTESSHESFSEYKVLHGLNNPINDIGDNYSIYINEKTLETFQKNNGVWIDTETKGNESYFKKTTADSLSQDSDYYKLDTVYAAIIRTLLSTNATCEMVLTNTDELFTAGVLTFDGLKQSYEIFTNKESFEEKNKEDGHYQKHSFMFDINTKEHLYYSNGEWVEPDFMISSYAVNCLDKYFASCGLDNGLSGLVVGQEYVKNDSDYIFTNIKVTSSIFEDNYSSYDFSANIKFTMDSSDEFITNIAFDSSFKGTFKGSNEEYNGGSNILISINSVQSSTVGIN